MKSERKKVLHLRTTDGFLGAENVVIELAKNSLSFGYMPIIGVIHNHDEGIPKLIKVAKKNKIETVLFPCRKRFDIKVINHLRRYIEIKGIDIVHTHGYKDDFYALFSLTKVPKVATNHLWKRSTISLKVYAYLDALMLRYFDKVVAVSEPIIEEMIHKGICKDKMLVIGNGVDVNKYHEVQQSSAIYQTKKELGLSNDCIIVGMISNLTKVKGHKYLIEGSRRVINKYKNVMFLIVGNGCEEEKLKNYVKELGLEEKYIFCGARDDIPELLAAMDIFVLPSLNEGLPMALLEAMASSKAVIATNVGDVGKVVRDKETGLLITPENIEDIEKSLLFLLENNDQKKKYEENAHNLVVEKYSSYSMTKSYCKEYDNLINKTNHTTNCSDILR